MCSRHTSSLLPGSWCLVGTAYLAHCCINILTGQFDHLCQGDQPGMFSAEEFQQLAPQVIHHNDYQSMLTLCQVDFFSLMTYDYSSPQRPGPNSPIDWVAMTLS